MAILQRDPIADRAEVLRTVRDEFKNRYDILSLDPLGFDNTYALAMPEALAKRLHITKVSDLLAHTDLRAGFASEFLARNDGWPGMSKAYGLTFKREPSSMEAGLMYQAAASGQVDVISAYSTDGRIDTLHLLVLEDDGPSSPPTKLRSWSGERRSRVVGPRSDAPRARRDRLRRRDAPD